MATELELANAAGDVVYEYGWFCESGKRLMNLGDFELNMWRVPLIEIHILHYRNLLHFFFSVSRRADDVSAALFLNGWSPGKPAWLATDLDRCNKLLAHITFKRQQYEARGLTNWDVEKTQSHIKPVWELFISGLPRERMHWFANGTELNVSGIAGH